MNIVFVGPHRVGKTTLAKEFAAESSNYQYFTLHVSDYFKKVNIDPSMPMDFETRLRVQFELLTMAGQQYREAISQTDKHLVCDRSPLDFMAYLLADVTMSSPDYLPALRSFEEEAIALHKEIFGYTVLIQPGIQYVHEEAKGSPSQSYIFMLNYLYKGLISKCKGSAFVMPTSPTSVNYRMKLLNSFVI